MPPLVPFPRIVVFGYRFLAAAELLALLRLGLLHPLVLLRHAAQLEQAGSRDAEDVIARGLRALGLADEVNELAVVGRIRLRRIHAYRHALALGDPLTLAHSLAFVPPHERHAGNGQQRTGHDALKGLAEAREPTRVGDFSKMVVGHKNGVLEMNGDSRSRAARFSSLFAACRGEFQINRIFSASGSYPPPALRRRGAGAEGLQHAALLVVEDRPVQAQRAGVRRINEAAGIVRAHLEDHAHFKFAERLPAHAATHVVERVHRGDEVNAQRAALCDDLVELRAGVRRVYDSTACARTAPMTSVSYRLLYAFVDADAALVEIKRLDRAADAPPDQVYRWLWLTPSESARLTFRAMQRGALEHREFAEGELSFEFGLVHGLALTIG